MTESIIIEYAPLSNNIVHIRRMHVFKEELYGIAVVAYIFRKSINITLSNKTLNLSQINDFLGNNDQQYDYSAIIGLYTAKFKDIEFLKGIVSICVLFGVDPLSIIKDVKYRSFNIKVDPKRYFGKISIPNFTNYEDGSIIDMSIVKDIMSKEIFNSLSQSLYDGFPESKSIGIFVPSELFTITTDESHTDVIASCLVTKFFPESLSQYRYLNAYYISNVCVRSEYKGQGLAKSVIVAMINDLCQRKIFKFILEVSPDNDVAYNLYTSLGFVKFASTKDDHYIYHVLFLDLSTT